MVGYRRLERPKRVWKDNQLYLFLSMIGNNQVEKTAEEVPPQHPTFSAGARMNRQMYYLGGKRSTLGTYPALAVRLTG